MTTQRQRQRRTLGSGPPPDLLFGELAYSDTDGLLHVGRPDGSARSFGSSAAPAWESITDTPATFPPSAHTHDYAALVHTHDYAALVHTHDYAASVHGHTWASITETPATFPPSAHTHDYAALVHTHDYAALVHTHDYAASVHGHPWSSITDTPATFPTTWAEVASKPSTFPTTWAEVASKPSTFPTTWAEVASKPATFPAEAHSHGQTTISLTPLNGFTAVNSNRLIVFPDLRLALLLFSLARTTIPAQNTVALSWAAGYTALFPTRVTVVTVGGANNDTAHMIISGSTLLYNRRTGVSTQIDVSEGQLFFTY